MYSWGTNSSLNFSYIPQKIDYDKMFHVNQLHGQNTLIPVKISCTWSRTISIFYLNAININKCKKNINREIISKNLRNFTK
jgi:hypothetical protein